MAAVKPLTEEQLEVIKARFEIVGSDVVAKVDYGGRQGNKVKAGQIAGSVDNLGYRRIGLYGRMVLAHRVAWVIANGSDPHPHILDHIDGDPSNNSPKNLRLATDQQNQRNKRPNRGGTSKFLGVYWDQSKSKWKANIGVDGKLVYLGLFTSEIEAALAYDAYADSLNCDFQSTNRSLGLLETEDIQHAA